ncbi:MAG: hypothetical protein PHG04_04240, partial [Candidatus Nanoarchaeia archaeon]|nr:hypothetical protein [Candidatus Nanoarchaeia archaeon]
EVIGAFDSCLKNRDVFFEAFNVSLGNDFLVEYNFENDKREFDIILLGKKRLGIGLLLDSPYNIEIQANRCNKKIVNKKYDDDLMSMVLVNGASNSSIAANKAYSFVGFKNGLFTPLFLDNYCEKVLKILGKNNVAELEKILYSGIPLSLKNGALYYFCDELAKYNNFRKIVFIPSLMQATLIGKSFSENCVIDSGVNRKKIINHSLSKSYEKYLNAHFGKDFSKKIDSKNFSLMTFDSCFADSCSGSEIGRVVLLEAKASHCLENPVKFIKKL